MSGPEGSAFLLKLGSPDGSYATGGGFRVTHEQFQANSITLTARGIFTGHAAESMLKNHALGGEPVPFELSFESGERYRASFTVSSIRYVGLLLDERNYEISLTSVGDVEVL